MYLWNRVWCVLEGQLTQAYLYITRALKDHTGHVMGAMKLVVDSYTSDEIDVVGLNLYVSG